MIDWRHLLQDGLPVTTPAGNVLVPWDLTRPDADTRLSTFGIRGANPGDATLPGRTLDLPGDSVLLWFSSAAPNRMTEALVQGDGSFSLSPALADPLRRALGDPDRTEKGDFVDDHVWQVGRVKVVHRCREYYAGPSEAGVEEVSFTPSL